MNRLAAVSLAFLLIACTSLILLNGWSVHLADERAAKTRSIVVHEIENVQRENRQLIKAIAEYLVCVYDMQYEEQPRPVDSCGPLLEEVLRDDSR